MNQRQTQLDEHETHAQFVHAQRIAFIHARWHGEIVDQARIGFLQRAGTLGISEQQVDLYPVPGSLEIPLQAKSLADSGRYAVIVAAGLIVDGGIYRHDFVARTVLDGIMRVQLDCDIPILSVVLTPHHFQETAPHEAFFHGHFHLKGAEAAEACVQTLTNRFGLLKLAANA